MANNDNQRQIVWNLPPNMNNLPSRLIPPPRMQQQVGQVRFIYIACLESYSLVKSIYWYIDRSIMVMTKIYLHCYEWFVFMPVFVFTLETVIFFQHENK